MVDTSYHREIDGLRAISVIVIIFFHLKVAFFQGGFIGVDIFFVVSGYLITQIIVSNLENGQFSFKEFYIRRSARILPALVTTILIVLPVAMYLLQPEALVHTAKQGIYALFSLSNFFFWTEASYWAPSAENYVLLHTWSLGVEEQFYLVYPLLLVACHRMAGARGVIVLLAVISLLGTFASEMVLRTDRSAAFYFTPLRFYEFALGGLAATIPGLNALQQSSRASAVATIAGLVLILFGSIRFNGYTALPGILILVPILGALLVLLAGPSAGARVLLMNPLASWFGKNSYSLYLTHWPIVVFYRYYFGANFSLLEQTALFVAILATGSLLNRCVERRFRLSHGAKATAGGVPSRKVLLATFAAAIGITITSTALITNQGWPSRMPDGTKALLDINPREDMLMRKEFLQEKCQPKGDVFCGERQPGAVNILLLGDSRVLDMYMALKTAFPDANIQTSYAMGCAPVFSPDEISPFYPDCPKFNKARLQAALDAPAQDIVFLAQDLAERRKGAVLESVKRLRDAGKTVYLLGEFRIITQSSPIDIEIEALRFPERARHLDRYISENPFASDGEYAAKIKALGAIYVSNRDFFYDGEYHFIDRETGKFLTFDGKHLNEYGARKFGLYLRENYPLQ